MKTSNRFKFTLSLLAAAALSFLSTASSQAALYYMTLNTSSLLNAPANASAPFALDFQLNGGNPLGNTVTLSNFNFGGGAATASPAATTFGLASGSLGSSVTLSDNSVNPFNEFYQGFTPGSTLSFNVSITGNINTPTPDVFSVSILDSALANITTNGIGDSLAMITLDAATPTVQTFSGTGDFAGVTDSIVAVPEPATMSVGLALGLVGLASRRRTRQA